MISEAMLIVDATDLACGVRCVFSAVEQSVSSGLRYQNVERYDREFAGHLIKNVYIDRVAKCDPVSIVDFPRKTVVDGESFLTIVENAFVSEQCHPLFLASEEGTATLRSGRVFLRWAGRQARDVKGHHLLLARFGETTWGHWLAELLPRAVIAEKERPGFYTFVLPTLGKATDYMRRLRANVLASLRRYGIYEDRLFFLKPDNLYTFEALSTVTSVWSVPQMIHPEVLDLMRDLSRQTAAVARNIYIVRDRDAGRCIVNGAELADVARQHGFATVEVAQLTFDEQVAVFQNANKVIGVLGSDLAGLIYAPDRVGVMSLAPGNWGDRFFFALVQLRGGSYADVRGAPVGIQENLHRAPFAIDPCLFLQGMQAI